jgi:hypothetical protein
MIGVQPNGTEIDMNPPRLRVEAVEIDDVDDYLGKIVGRLPVTNQLQIVRFMKAEVAIALQFEEVNPIVASISHDSR